MPSGLTPAERDEINRKANGWIAKFVGGVLLWIGVAFAGLTIWAVYTVSLLKQPENAVAFLLAGGFALIAAFCFSVGWRFFWNRPNRYGSALGPVGWSVLCLLFSALGVLLTVGFGLARLLSDISLAGPVVGCFAFSFWCFRLARNALANGNKAAL